MVVPPVRFIPTNGLAAFAAVARKSAIRLLDAFTVVPPVTESPNTVEETPLLARLQIVFLKILAVVPPELTKPTTLEVDEYPLSVLLLILVTVAGQAFEIPVTVPPVPEEVRPVIELEAIVNAAMVPLPPTNNPVIVL